MGVANKRVMPHPPTLKKNICPIFDVNVVCKYTTIINVSAECVSKNKRYEKDLKLAKKQKKQNKNQLILLLHTYLHF